MKKTASNEKNWIPSKMGNLDTRQKREICIPDKIEQMKKKRQDHRMWTVLLAGILSCWMPLKGEAQDSLSSQHFFSVRVDDDFLNLAGQGTDRYYTGGDYYRYSFLAAAGKKRLLRKILYSPFTGTPSLYSIGATQWVYTPDNLSASTPVIGDYPYCGVLFLSLGRESLSPDHSGLFRSALWLGTMGPAAAAKEVQTFIHGMIKTNEPRGWGNQLPDYPVVNYSLYYEPNLFSFSRIFKVNGTGSVRAGTLQTDAQIGLDLLISNEKDNFFPARNAGTRNHSRKRPGFYVEVRPAVKFVGYNSILEGGPFDGRQYYHIPAEQITRILFEGTGIMGMQLGGFSIQYRQVIETAEFRTVQKQVYGGFLLQWRI
ncbi:MAG: lipid A deacylase LpxR family protein [Puia sp.]|nr:lipid A deacylase LpxR family protein [Puia sp.]